MIKDIGCKKRTIGSMVMQPTINMMLAREKGEIFSRINFLMITEPTPPEMTERKMRKLPKNWGAP